MPRRRAAAHRVPAGDLHQGGKKTVKVAEAAKVKKVERIVKERHLTPPPNPSRAEADDAKPAPPPPQGSHDKVLTAKPTPSAPSKPQDFTAPAGGKAA